jgi:SAM-dependent methyltransferase
MPAGPRPAGPRCALVPRSYLDPRPAEAAAERPILDAVNIPFDELDARTYELPPREIELPVAGPEDLAERVVFHLTARGRRARVADHFRYGPAACESARGTQSHDPVTLETGTTPRESEAAPPQSPGAALEPGASALESGRLWQPAAFLAQFAPQLEPGRALDLGCGAGREAVYLAAFGWHVVGVDVLPDALERAQRLAARHAPAIVPITWRCLDLEREPLAVEQRFDLVMAFRYLHRPLLLRAAELLRPGGHVVWETFTTVHRARHGRPTRDEHVLHPGELRALFADPQWQIQAFEEGWQGDRHTARIRARLGE